MVPKNIVTLARNLRKNQTFVEQLLWSKIRNNQISGYKFRRQYPVDNYILDFYCPAAKLDVEIDGGQHNEIENEHLDEARTKYLVNKGIRVIRFWDHEVINDLDAVITVIQDNLKPLDYPKK